MNINENKIEKVVSLTGFKYIFVPIAECVIELFQPRSSYHLKWHEHLQSCTFVCVYSYGTATFTSAFSHLNPVHVANLNHPQCISSVIMNTSRSSSIQPIRINHLRNLQARSLGTVTFMACPPFKSLAIALCPNICRIALVGKFRHLHKGTFD